MCEGVSEVVQQVSIKQWDGACVFLPRFTPGANVQGTHKERAANNVHLDSSTSLQMDASVCIYTYLCVCVYVYV